MKPTMVRLLLAIVCVGGLMVACGPSQEAKKLEAPGAALPELLEPNSDETQPPPEPVTKNSAAISVAPKSAKPPAMANGHPPKLLHHAYDLLSQFNSERQGYGMYTYVLFGHKVGADSPPLPHDVAQRYQALLEAIESSTSTAVDLEAAFIPKEETNLFCIPVTLAAARPTLDNYGSALALIYRSVALGGITGDARFREKLSSGAGPFLISSLRPLNQVRSAEPMLFADLSTHNPAAMREVVAAYKQRINRSVPDKVESFDPLRLALLTMILDADDHVKLVKEAVADWRDALPDP